MLFYVNYLRRRIRRIDPKRLLTGRRKVLGAILWMMLAILVTGSCKDDMEVFSITRVPIFSFSTDMMNTQSASEVSFTKGKNVLHQYPTGETVLYTRLLMQVKGENAAGKRYIISIEFDLTEQDSYVGTYRPEYVLETGGIFSFGFLEETATNVYKSYSLDPAGQESTYFRVEKQNMEERLLLGDFSAKLQNDQNNAEKLNLYLGNFKDISYGSN